MLTKNNLKYIQSLYHKKQRDEEKLFVAEGPKLAEELINSTFDIKAVYAVKRWIQKNSEVGVPVTEISEEELSRISNLQTPNEVVVIAAKNEVTGEPVLQNNITLVLDGIQDPGNMGTIIRTADWFGITQVVCSNDCVEMYNPKVIQATMGSFLRIDSWYKDFDSWKPPVEVPIYGALLNGRNVYTIGKVAEGLLVIGNESKGIREPMLSRIVHPVTIPRIGSAESLNAGVAAAIILGCMVNGSSK